MDPEQIGMSKRDLEMMRVSNVEEDTSSNAPREKTAREKSSQAFRDGAAEGARDLAALSGETYVNALTGRRNKKRKL